MTLELLLTELLCSGVSEQNPVAPGGTGDVTSSVKGFSLWLQCRGEISWKPFFHLPFTPSTICHWQKL